VYGKFNLLHYFISVTTACSKSETKTEQTPTVVTCTDVRTRQAFEKTPKFLPNNPLNTDISASPLNVNSADIISAIGSYSLHPDFGSGIYNNAPIGIPFSVLCGNQTKVAITYRANSYDGNYGNKSNNGPFQFLIVQP